MTFGPCSDRENCIADKHLLSKNTFLGASRDVAPNLYTSRYGLLQSNNTKTI